MCCKLSVSLNGRMKAFVAETNVMPPTKAIRSLCTLFARAPKSPSAAASLSLEGLWCWNLQHSYSLGWPSAQFFALAGVTWILRSRTQLSIGPMHLPVMASHEVLHALLCLDEFFVSALLFFFSLVALTWLQPKTNSFCNCTCKEMD